MDVVRLVAFDDGADRFFDMSSLVLQLLGMLGLVVVAMAWAFARSCCGRSWVRWYHFVLPVWFMANAFLAGFSDERWFEAALVAEGAVMVGVAIASLLIAVWS